MDTKGRKEGRKEGSPSIPGMCRIHTQHQHWERGGNRVLYGDAPPPPPLLPSSFLFAPIGRSIPPRYFILLNCTRTVLNCVCWQQKMQVDTTCLCIMHGNSTGTSTRTWYYEKTFQVTSSTNNILIFIYKCKIWNTKWDLTRRYYYLQMEVMEIFETRRSCIPYYMYCTVHQKIAVLYSTYSTVYRCTA